MSNETRSSASAVNALKPILMEERMSWQSMVFVQAGICVCAPSLLLGAILAESMSVPAAIVSGTLGYVIVVIIMSILGQMGSDLGVAPAPPPPGRRWTVLTSVRFTWLAPVPILAIHS